jgi:protein disulfide-isomerase-like protein
MYAALLTSTALAVAPSLLLLLLLAVRGSRAMHQSEHLVVLHDSAEFAREAAASPLLVKFYAPWCGHCKNMKDTWDELANDKNTRSDSTYRVAAIDCTADRATCTALAVRGYPTIAMVHSDGFVYVYRGPRTVDGFASFASSIVAADAAALAAKDRTALPASLRPATDVVSNSDTAVPAAVATNSEL